MADGPPEPTGLAAIAADVRALQDQAADLSDDLSTIKAQTLALKVQNSNLMEELHRIYAAVAAIDRRLAPAGVSGGPA
jgi:cell division protein FtsB